MVSIRENVFETNSSSCHSLVICRDDLKEKLKNREVLYIGQFEYADDYAIYENKLTPDTVLTKEALVGIFKKFVDGTWESEYLQEYQTWLKNNDFEHMGMQDILNAHEEDHIDLSFILESYDIYWTPVELILESEDTHVISEYHCIMDSEPTTIFHTNIYC